MAEMTPSSTDQPHDPSPPATEAEHESVSSAVASTDDINLSDSSDSQRGAPHQKTTGTNATESTVTFAVSHKSPRLKRTHRSLASIPRDTVSHVQKLADIYGPIGLPAMIFIFVLSATWTTVLAVIQARPSEVANDIMNTTMFDNGEFWLLPNPDPMIEIPAIVLLLGFSLGYLGLVVVMLFPDKFIRPHQTHKSSWLSSAWAAVRRFSMSNKAKNEVNNVQVVDLDSIDFTPVRKPRLSSVLRGGWTWERVKYELTSPHGLARQYYNPALDLPKLIFQTTTLVRYLQDGFPLAIICIYSSLLLLNWMISCYRYKREHPDPNYIVVRIFYRYSEKPDDDDRLFAPLEVLAYAYYNFAFPRDVFETRVETLGNGSFERVARLFADPAEVSMFRIAFHYLQFSDLSSLLIKSALNMLSLFKWMRCIVHLVDNHRERQNKQSSSKLTPTSSMLTARRRAKQHNTIVAYVFFCAGWSIFIFSIIAITSTNAVCAKHPQCVVKSYQWNAGADKCSCIVFVDRSTAVSTFDDWQSPPDTTENLALLASSGHLRIVQIINRALPSLPEELHGCHHLEQLILIYTKTESLPDWTKEFTHLEYLHIEADILSDKQLASMPVDLFANMKHLTFLHFGALTKLPQLPDLHYSTEVRYLTLAALHSITYIPSLDALSQLKRIILVEGIRLYELPSLANLKSLVTFQLTSRTPTCCNGYLSGTCDLTNYHCKNRTATEPLVQCTSKRISTADMTVLKRTAGPMCDPALKSDIKDYSPSRQSTDIACGGIKYKQCTLFGISGMCYNSRMMVISCEVQSRYQDMRRLQIARKVGEPCNPTVEAWLGCA